MLPSSIKLITVSSPFTPPPGATQLDSEQQQGPVIFPNGVYFGTYAQALLVDELLFEAMNAAGFHVKGLQLGQTGPTIIDGIRSPIGAFKLFGITPAPHTAPKLSDITCWEWRGNFTLTRPVTIPTAEGPTVLPIGTVCSVDESLSYIAARANYYLAPGIDKNRQQVPGTSGENARMQSIPTSLGFVITPGNSGAIAQAQVCWNAPK